jgi:hypothetical protein
MEQCNVSMRMTLAKRRLSLESGWLGVLLFHTFFSLSVLLLFSLLLDSPFDASLHSSYTYYPTPCLFTHSANPTSTHHFPCTGVCFFRTHSCSSPRFIPFHSCFYFIFCPLSLIVMGSLYQRHYHFEEIAVLVLKHWLLVGSDYYYRRLLMKLWNNTPFCCFFHFNFLSFI